jgi:tetratricopeptide (TPR) repeat protein
MGDAMEVPMRLIPRTVTARTDAVVIFTHAAADVLRVAGMCGLDWPEVFRVAGGFVVVPAAPLTGSVAGAIRLRRLAGSLFVPRDADVRPTLRTDEVLSLTRTQGLVLLPQLTALAFDPESPLREVEFLTPPPRSRREWQPLPEVQAVPRELTVIQAVLPESPAAILDGGEPDGAAPVSTGPNAPVPEGARPPGAGFFKSATAGAQLAAGRALNFLGRTTGMTGIAALGSMLAKSALEAVPQLTETILGKQERALREILRQLERGNVEEALRRAPPAFADPDAPKGRIDGGSSLSLRNFSYSLSSLLGGTAGVGWLGGGDVWGQLAQHYRKLAEDAVRRGDVRRAAYIYGVLLRDVRAAANALAGGGLHRDAAILYRDKIKDLPQAALQFEKAGDFDEALRLYLHLSQYEPAAELMRRLGDEGRAVELFRRAADAMVVAKRHLNAGDLVRDKIGDLAVAEAYYAHGWGTAGSGRLGCAERLIDLQSAGERWGDLGVLIADAETCFAPPHTEEASRFFELVLRQEAAMPAAFRDDVRDQARLCLAGHLRDHAAENSSVKNVVTQAFGGSAGWSGSLVRDAHVALKHELAGKPKPAVKTVNAILSQLVTGPVTAAVATPSGSVIVAGLHGETQRYVSPTGGVETVQGAGAYASAGNATVVALATDDEATYVVNLTHLPDSPYPLKFHSFWKRGRGPYRFYNSIGLQCDGGFPTQYLMPTIATFDLRARVVDLSESRTYFIPGLRKFTTKQVPNSGCRTRFVAANSVSEWVWDEVFANYSMPKEELNLSHSMPWVPCASHDHALTQPPVSWLAPEPSRLELAGVDQHGVAHWSQLNCCQRTLTGLHARGSCPEGYAACCFVAPGHVVAVTTTGTVVKLLASGNNLVKEGEPVARIGHASRAVFAAYQPAVREVVVVFSDGVMARVKI